MNFLFTCGGTAGHINPALAVAGVLRDRMPDCGILFVGANGKMETDLVPRAGYDIVTVEVTNIHRSLKPSEIMYNFRSLHNARQATKDARKIIEDFKPDVAIGTGGYVCYPVLKAAAQLGIPTIVHESNAVPGLTTKMLAGAVDRILVGFEESKQHYSEQDKVVVTGTPVRGAFTACSKAEAKRQLGLDPEADFATLSGGNKRRVALARALVASENLLLDEPTNHLDIASKEILEEALNSYTGTVFYVSHDRYFINQTATRILDLTNQAIVNYIGDYDYYLEKKEELTEKYAPAAAQAVTEAKQASDNKLSWQQQKEEQARQRKRENELKKVEARIEELETRDKEIDETMILPDICTNVAECAKLSKEKATITEELEGLYEKWEELA